MASAPSTVSGPSKISVVCDRENGSNSYLQETSNTVCSMHYELLYSRILELEKRRPWAQLRRRI